jgi:hypothetical protein
MGFFRLNFDASLRDAWFLGAPRDRGLEEIDPRLFTVGKRFDGHVSGFSIPVRKRGREVPFNLASLDMPVVRVDVFNAIASELVLNVQTVRFPIEQHSEPFDVLNVLDVLPALDRNSSRMMLWGEDSARPEMVGRIRMVTDLAISTEVAKNCHIFRLQDWTQPIVVSAEFRETAMRRGLLGARFEMLCSS